MSLTVHIPTRSAAPVNADRAIADTLAAGRARGLDVTDRTGTWKRGAVLATAAPGDGRLPSLFSGTVLRARANPDIAEDAVTVDAAARDARTREAAGAIRRPDLTDGEWLLAAETYIALEALRDRQESDPLDTWLYAEDADALLAAVAAVTAALRRGAPAAAVAASPPPPTPETLSEDEGEVATSAEATRIFRPPPLPPPPLPAPAAAIPAVPAIPAAPVAPVLQRRPVGPGPIGGRPGAVLAPPATALVGLLRTMARDDGLAADAYEWPNTRILDEATLADLWRRIPGDRVDPAEITLAFGPPPYFFLKPWGATADIGPPPSPPPSGRRVQRGVVNPAYRALKPGPNYYHHGGQLVDQCGRLYAIGTESTSDLPVLYYKRPRKLVCDHPRLGERLVLRHALASPTCPGACPGHVATVEGTRIAPRAASGVVFPVRMPPGIA